jgi:hypothetical protein
MAKARKTLLELADAQFIGFHFGKREPGIISLVESMGLTKSEWIKWKTDFANTYLTDNELKEVDEHFQRF